MKVLTFLFCFISFPLKSNAQTLFFKEGNIGEAMFAAKSAGKPICFMGYANWCGHCHTMKETVLLDSSVNSFFSENFVCYMQDMEQGDGIEFRRKYRIRSYPAFVFMDQDGKLQYMVIGEFKAPEFIAEGKNALNPEKQLPTLKQKFDMDVSNAENYTNFLTALRKAKLDYDEITKKYFKTQSDSQLISEANWKLISQGVRDYDSREIQFVMKHRKEFDSIATPEKVNRKLVSTVWESLNPLVERGDTLNYFRKRKTGAAMGLPKSDSLIFSFDMRIAEKTKNWNAYKKVTLASTDKYYGKSQFMLKNIATAYLNNISDKTALKQAAEWAKKATALREDYTCYLTAAKLFKRVNDTNSALQMAQAGKDFAGKFKWDTTEADNLIKELTGKE
ncbi:MAG: hypothetical protein A3H98_11090 [Bacteroidetes bacterium RIFCSPLOWO2_02_FULL_36_8]|nr:MAG: hypothetical protein A3H98_11090 [Bacteroidetes bacterium RIFCSPLOWO2_02_FULL_36_8]OFY70736.1 MAG: hypothetical protein A3G23_07640 [Bacteroidetes bacterium RIFCSPLOWO2_12_FULL_37_12]